MPLTFKLTHDNIPLYNYFYTIMYDLFNYVVFDLA